MCSPALFLGGAGALSIFAQLQAGEVSSEIGEFNQAVLNKQAEQRIEAGKVEEQKFRRTLADVKSGQKTGFAASGVDVGVGSPVDILADTAALGELDAQTIRHTARVEASNIRARGTSLRLQGELDKAQTRAGIAGTLLTTGGSIAAL